MKKVSILLAVICLFSCKKKEQCYTCTQSVTQYHTSIPNSYGGGSLGVCDEDGGKTYKNNHNIFLQVFTFDTVDTNNEREVGTASCK